MTAKTMTVKDLFDIMANDGRECDATRRDALATSGSGCTSREGLEFWVLSSHFSDHHQHLGWLGCGVDELVSDKKDRGQNDRSDRQTGQGGIEGTAARGGRRSDGLTADTAR